MQLFSKKDPLVTAEETLAALEARENGLRSRLAASRTDLESAIGDRRSLLVSDAPDDGAIAAADARVARLHAAVDGLEDAIATVAAQRVSAEEALAGIRDGLARTAEAERVDRAIASATESAAALDVALAAVVEAFAVFGAGEQPARLAAISRQRFLNEAGEALHQLTLYKTRLLSGEAALPPPPKPKLEVVAPEPAPAPIAKKAVFPVKNIKWTDEHGEVQMCNKYRTIEIPLSLVARALAAGAVREPSDPTCKQLVLAHGGGMGWPDPASCVDLDALPAATEAA